MSSYDVIVIGSGAGGGTLVRHLAPSGKRILLLGRGDWLRRERPSCCCRRPQTGIGAASPTVQIR
jgi:choline dehydrogenase-like flavoprotein